MALTFERNLFMPSAAEKGRPSFLGPNGRKLRTGQTFCGDDRVIPGRSSRICSRPDAGHIAVYLLVILLDQVAMRPKPKTSHSNLRQ